MSPRHRGICAFGASGILVLVAAFGNAAEDPEVQKLAQEVGKKGWLVFSAKTHRSLLKNPREAATPAILAARKERGVPPATQPTGIPQQAPDCDFDLFLAQPDGSGLRNITHNPAFDDFGGRFSPDGTKLLFRCLKKGSYLGHVGWGPLGTLVIADADGSNPQEIGKEGEYPWATWSPDGSQIACLYRKESKIRIFNLGTMKLAREMPSCGIHNQLGWSSDGKRFCGTAYLAGGLWNIGVIDIETGKFAQVSRGLNCTPDWFQSDPLRVLYSNGEGLDNDRGWVFLMQAQADGKSRSLLYAERKQHIYFGCTSPDDQYVIFSRRAEQDGALDGPMAIVRLADTPIIGPEPYPRVEAMAPEARRGPVYHLENLPTGFEPHWTYADVGTPKADK